MKSKQNLLNTPMNQLGLGGAFNSWFFRKTRMQQEQVINLGEFIKLNQDIKANKDNFVCSTDKENHLWLGGGFIKESVSWKKLKKFLTSKGFTQKDWVMLLPEIKTSKGIRLDYSKLSKAQLLEMRICKITDVKANCQPLKLIAGYLAPIERDYKSETLKVGELLPFGLKELSTKMEWCFNDTQVQNTFRSIQKKLFGYGLTQKDGPFMEIKFAGKTKKDFIQGLIQNRGFTKIDAVNAVKIGIKAGWINF